MNTQIDLKGNTLTITLTMLTAVDAATAYHTMLAEALDSKVITLRLEGMEFSDAAKPT